MFDKLAAASGPAEVIMLNQTWPKPVTFSLCLAVVQKFVFVLLTQS